MSETGNISKFNWRGEFFSVDFEQAISISHVIRSGNNNPNCFYAPDPSFTPFQSGDFIGSLESGAPVNFYNIAVNPHGSTTHTECVGHIREGYVLKDCLIDFFQMAYVLNVSISQMENGDSVIQLVSNDIVIPKNTTALILKVENFDRDNLLYSGKNPLFVSKMLIIEINRLGVQHLLVQMPSIDREEDGGKLEAHHAFWIHKEKVFKNKTITELICLPEGLEEGRYILNLQVLNIELDVSPSNPILYKIIS